MVFLARAKQAVEVKTAASGTAEVGQGSTREDGKKDDVRSKGSESREVYEAHQ